MKQFLSLVLFLALLTSGFCQEKKTVKINPVHDENPNFLSPAFYQYKNFLEGKILFKDNSISTAMLNYNRVLGEVHFISPRGDTLQLAHPETMDAIIIGADTFYYFEKSYGQLLSHNGNVNLGVRKVLKYIGKEKKGAYGTYSAVASITSYDSYSPDEQITEKMVMDENSIFKYITSYYLVDPFHNFVIANKKNFHKMFSGKQKQLSAYLGKNRVDFQKENDLKRLIEYLHNN